MIREIDPAGEHASWWENFAWTRLPGVEAPTEAKPMVDLRAMQRRDPAGVRELIGDGSFGGRYARPDEDLELIWDAAVAEARDVLEHGWR